MRREEREIKDEREIESIFSRSDVCRIAMADDNIPYIVTMNFGYIFGETGKTLYFHCASEGRKLEMIRKNNYVCFETDTDHNFHKGETACNYGMGYSSVTGYGKITIVSDENEKKKGLDAVMSHYTGKDEFSYGRESFRSVTVLRLDITEMTGKKCI